MRKARERREQKENNENSKRTLKKDRTVIENTNSALKKEQKGTSTRFYREKQ